MSRSWHCSSSSTRSHLDFLRAAFGSIGRIRESVGRQLACSCVASAHAKVVESTHLAHVAAMHAPHHAARPCVWRFRCGT